MTNQPPNPARSWNPFKKVSNGREVWAWGMYDLANQSFQLVINTLLFGVYVAKVVVGGDSGQTSWGNMVAVATLAIVVLSPVAGALADQKAWKKELLIGTGLICSVLTALLALVAPGQVWLAAALYIPAAIACGLGENFLASFLPEIANQKTMGFVSAIGWSLSYLGALILLGICALVVFGTGRGELAEARPLLVLSGVWFLLGMLPATFLLRERAEPQKGSALAAIGASFSRLALTIRQARRYRQLVRFLAIFFLYSLGTQTVIYLAGNIMIELGFTFRDTVLFFLLLTLNCGVAALLTAKYQDRWGGKRTVMLFLLVWAVSTIALAGLTAVHSGKPPAWVLWVTGNGLGLGLGGIGTASRAMVGIFTPAAKSGEFFGLWGMVYKLSAVVGVPLFSIVFSANRSVALAMLAGSFAIGFILVRVFIDESEGVRAAGGPAGPGEGTATPG